ncbi:family 43 glycosylhydrolase [uncultured Dysgonomonas sp.]|uniref:Arabinan endo-1,5-alpha-L-arabinosidase n=1 Tax=uncultured Dysgonomonas sp. TaxID=206096 RepID=A0A212JFY7_9BACT|nr:family 43 glycosylhydrolase [uncultured Dysgonomonas sp.]SBV98165.1 conserved hypothetical protein [uncultured Dysgonomonas sp.]
MKRIFIYQLFLIVFTSHIYSCKDSENKMTEGEITSFSVWDQKSVNHILHVDNVNNVISNKEELPTYVNLKELLIEFKVNTGDVILKLNGKVQQSGGNKNDFSKECIYDLYVGDTKQKSYTVKITKPQLSNSFQTFTFPEKQMEQYQPAINTETGEISNGNEIPSNIDITSLQPEFTTSEKSSVVKVNGVVQKSGNARHDFTKPITYNIEGEDGTSKQYRVTLKQGNQAILTNPVIVGSYADPTVIRVGKEFYLYVTSGRVRGYKSTDLINWPRIGGSKSEVFDKRPDFTDDDVNDTGMWAPDINYYDGKYVMYYAISKWSGGATCGIGVGVSDKPEGPFVPPAGNSNGKLFVSAEIGVHNSIDPCFVEEDGKRYLFWGSFYGIYMTELTADGMAVKDLTKKTLIAGKSFEAPYIHKRGKYYYLFVSTGACCEGMTSSYKVMVGRSESLSGPYLNKTGTDMKTFDAWNPSNYQPVVVKGDATFGGPGHNARIITDDNGIDWMLYHAYIDNGSSQRNLMLDRVKWDDEGWPIVGNGTPSYSIDVVPVFK